MLSLPITAHAATAQATTGYVILDLRKEPVAWCPAETTDLNDLQSTNAVYVFNGDTVNEESTPTPCDTNDKTTAQNQTPPQNITAPLTRFLACASQTGKDPCKTIFTCACKPANANEAVDQKDYSAAAVLAFAQAHASKSIDRWISQAGDELHIYAITDKGITPQVKVDETARKTTLATDIRTLLRVATNVVGAQSTEGARYRISAYRYTLTKRRANLTVTAALLNEKKEPGPTVATAKVVTGPTEHLFLSADVPLNSGKQLKFDDKNNAIVTRDDPKAFYASINGRLGDLFHDDRWWEKIVIKGLVAASKHPLDGYGIGIGIRGDVFGRWGLELDGFSPFVAWMSVKNDETAIANGASKRSSQTRIGISLNLDKAVDWLAPKKKEDKTQ